MNRPERKSLLHLDANLIRIVVNNLVVLHTSRLRTKVHHAVKRDTLVVHAVEDVPVRLGITNGERDHEAEVLAVRYVRHLPTRTRDGHGTSAREAVKEPLLAVLVASVPADVLRPEAAPLQAARGERLLHLHVASTLLHGVSLDVRWGVRRLVHAARRHEQKLARTARLGVVNHGTHRAHVLAVVVNDGVEPRASANRSSDVVRRSPHRRHAELTELVEVAERRFVHALVILRTCNHNGDGVASLRELLAEPKSDGRVTTALRVDNENGRRGRGAGCAPRRRAPGDAPGVRDTPLHCGALGSASCEHGSERRG
mmetsp:Transcript_1010/g.2235  ORF Transcript_1010/g.2235 Transcript_1010/m.2235 type:complete len:313 (+) Transcript_1010:928-1866(+)